MKRFVIIFIFFFPLILNAQFSKFAGGLGFSSGVEYPPVETGNIPVETGNPAFWGRAYYKLSKRLYLAPTFTFFKPGVKSTFEIGIKNYMLQGDFDINYGVFHQDEIRLFAFTGFNATNIMYRVEIKDFAGGDYPEDKSDLNFGANLGAALEMRVDDYFDAYLSGKYIAGSWSQFVVSLGVIYNLEGRRGRGW